MKKLFLPVTVIVILAMSVTAMAFNGQRKGFILGGGLGLGMSSYTQSLESGGIKITGDRTDKGAFMTDFKIGYAPNDQTEIYYASKVSWFGMTNAYGNDVTVADGLGAIGFSRYLAPTVPAWFLSAGIALSTWSLPFEDDNTAWQGFGLYGGAGYEFSRHVNLEMDLMWGNPSHSEGGIKASTNSFSVKFTLNALAY